jgi:hypothetical protein
MTSGSIGLSYQPYRSALLVPAYQCPGLGSGKHYLEIGETLFIEKKLLISALAPLCIVVARIKPIQAVEVPPDLRYNQKLIHHGSTL